MIPLLPSGPQPCALLCPINPIAPGQWVNTRNGRRGYISGYAYDGSSVRVRIDIGWKWGLYPEDYTIAELSKYNSDWRRAA